MECTFAENAIFARIKMGPALFESTWHHTASQQALVSATIRNIKIFHLCTYLRCDIYAGIKLMPNKHFNAYFSCDDVRVPMYSYLWLYENRNAFSSCAMCGWVRFRHHPFQRRKPTINGLWTHHFDFSFVDVPEHEQRECFEFGTYAMAFDWCAWNRISAAGSRLLGSAFRPQRKLPIRVCGNGRTCNKTDIDIVLGTRKIFHYQNHKLDGVAVALALPSPPPPTNGWPLMAQGVFPESKCGPAAMH